MIALLPGNGTDIYHGGKLFRFLFAPPSFVNSNYAETCQRVTARSYLSVSFIRRENVTPKDKCHSKSFLPVIARLPLEFFFFLREIQRSTLVVIRRFKFEFQYRYSRCKIPRNVKNIDCLPFDSFVSLSVIPGRYWLLISGGQWPVATCQESSVLLLSILTTTISRAS